MTAVTPLPTPAESAPVPSAQRQIPLLRRSDLVIQPMEFRGATWWVLKDPLGMRYYRLKNMYYRVFCLLDGNRSLKEIKEQLAVEFPCNPVQLADVQRMITTLHQQGLILSQRPGQSGQLIDKQRKAASKKRRQTLGSPLAIRLPGWDPDAALGRMHTWLRWIFHPATAIFATIFVFAAWMLLLVQVDEFRSRLPAFQQFFGWQNIIWLWITLSATKVLHEFGHGLTCKHYGSECHEMGVMILVFSPTLYCDVTDSWMLRDKWQRIWISAAGVVVEVVLSAIAIFVWWWTTPGLLNHLSLNVFFVTTITTVAFNANPLMRYDGYYALSDWLEIPNLRDKASRQLRDSFAEICLGIESPSEIADHEEKSWWFITYAVVAAVYSWFVLGSVLLFLTLVLEPYGLQSVGIMLAVVSSLSVVGNIVRQVWQILAAPRSEPMSRIRTSTTVAVVCALFIAALTIPLPWPIEVPVLIESHDVAHVLTSVPGQLVSFKVHPGDPVQKGQVLAKLVDDEKEDQLRQLESVRESLVAEVGMFHALELSSEHSQALKRQETIDREIEDLRQQLREYTVIAPISGKVVQAPRVPQRRAASSSGDASELQLWSGHIENPENQGCLLATRTHLVSVAPDDRMQALLYLDQAHRDDVSMDQQIEIKFEHLPDQTFRARINEIAREQSTMAPIPLSTKLGGSLNTVTDREGRERLTSIVYQAQAILDQETQLLKPGMRGTARFYVNGRSAGQWIWRSIRRTMRFAS